jgi:hypothetical protein
MENRGFNRNLIKLGYYETLSNNYEVQYNKKNPERKTNGASRSNPIVDYN